MARRLFSRLRSSVSGASRSVPATAPFSRAGLAKGMLETSLAPLASRGFQRLDASACPTQSARETMSGVAERLGGSSASMVVMDFELSQRMAIFGWVSGWRVVRHSGCQRRMTTIVAMRRRRHSRAAVRLGWGLRRQEVTDKTPTRISAVMPIQSVAGVGDRWSTGLKL